MKKCNTHEHQRIIDRLNELNIIAEPLSALVPLGLGNKGCGLMREAMERAFQASQERDRLILDLIRLGS